MVVKEGETTAFSLPSRRAFFASVLTVSTLYYSWSLEQARKFFELYIYDNTSKENLDERK